MRDPKKVLTNDGYIKYITCLKNIADSAFWLNNHADDLLLDEESVTALFYAQDLAESLLVKKDFGDE